MSPRASAVWAALAAAGCGVLHATSFAPSSAWWLQLLSLAALAALVLRARPAQAALRGFAFGLGWLAVGLWWLYISLHDYGGLAPPLAAGAVLLLAAFLSLYPAAAMAAWAALPAHPSLRVGLFACVWLASELARATWFTGFPWIASGYAHTQGPLAAWAPWVGVYGISFLAAGMAGALAVAGVSWGRRRWAWLGGIALLLAAGSLLPQRFTQAVGTLQVTLLQPNVPQSQKFDPALIERNLDALLGQMEAATTPLVISPESVLPVPMSHLQPESVERMLKASAQRVIWLGTFLGSNEEGWVNSMRALNEGAAVHDYGKRHLLPFGEFIPPGFAWFVRLLNIPIDSQASGSHQQPLEVGGLRLRPLICYEDLFGEDFVASAVDGPDAAHVFVNTSNLAWFGRYMVQDQHLQFSQMRALEFQRPFVRSTNTGATAHVDHEGRVLARLPALERGALVVTVEGRSGSTPYARWLHLAGLWPLWALALLPLLGLALLRRRQRAP